MTPDRIWVREGILPAHPYNRAPQFDMADGKDFVVPHPRHARKDIQQQEIRDLETDTKLYYPKGYHPVMMFEWPIKGDLVISAKDIPEAMKAGMGEAARDRAKLRKANGLPVE